MILVAQIVVLHRGGDDGFYKLMLRISSLKSCIVMQCWIWLRGVTHALIQLLWKRGLESLKG